MFMLDEVLNKYVYDEKKSAALPVASALRILNVEKGVASCAGKRDTYMKVISKFTAEAGEFADRLEAAYSAGDMEEYRAVAHGMKGASRMIAAYPVGDEAEKMEHAAKAGDKVYVDEHHKEFIELIKEMITEIETLTKS
jgi:HPt (histidine-containing phosphotransfer) domain-containing protein